MPISKINTTSITDNSVTAGKIVAGAVDADIAAGSIDTAQIADDAVTSAKLGTNIDIAGTLDVTGITTLDATTTITTSDNTPQLSLVSTDADNAVGPNLELYRNSSSPADGDNIGVINWYAENDADEKTHIAQIRGYIADVTDGSEDARFIVQTTVAGQAEVSRLEFLGNETIINQDSKDLDFRVETDGNTHGLFVDGAHNAVGIGTLTYGASPQLHILGSSATPSVDLLLQSDDTANAISKLTLYSRNVSNGNKVANIVNTAGALSFGTNDGTARATIDTSGNMLLNTTVIHGTNSKMSVKTETDKSGVGITAYKSTNTNYYFMNFIANTTSVGDIYSNGSSTTYATSSDYRLKENVVDLTSASTRLNQLSPKRFNFISDETNTLVDGFLAHEVQSVVPEAVLGTHNGMKDEEYEVTAETETEEAVMGTRSVPWMQGIDQGKLVPLLTAALQEALSEIESLKTRVQTLEDA